MCRHHASIALAALAALATTLVIAACGGSTPKPSPSSNSQLALAQCMRAHGVPNFPDPQQGPGGEGLTIQQPIGGGPITVFGIPFSGPAFDTAMKTCKLFGGGSAPPPISESQKEALIANADCMRRHGDPNFPDPTFPAGGGISRQSGPGLNPNSPAFQAALKTCQAGRR